MANTGKVASGCLIVEGHGRKVEVDKSVILVWLQHVPMALESQSGRS